MNRCEVCEKPIPEGQEVVHPEEGDSYCAMCVVGLIGAERDALRAFAQEVVSSYHGTAAARIKVLAERGRALLRTPGGGVASGSQGRVG
jgi:hypothetical protein